MGRESTDDASGPMKIGLEVETRPRYDCRVNSLGLQ